MLLTCHLQVHINLAYYAPDLTVVVCWGNRTRELLHHPLKHDNRDDFSILFILIYNVNLSFIFFIYNGIVYKAY